MTDNAKNYMISQAFQAPSDPPGTPHAAHRPQTNGKAERFNRTLLDRMGLRPRLHTNDERLDASPWLSDYN